MFCHVLRVLQTGIYKKPPDIKHHVVGGKVSKSWSILSSTKIANRLRKTQDLFAGQKYIWRGFEKATQDLFILNFHQTITQRIEKQHSIQQERRESFTDDNDAVYTSKNYYLYPERPVHLTHGTLRTQTDVLDVRSD